MIFHSFLKKFRYTKIYRTRFSIFSTPLFWGPIGVGSRAANLASKYDCSNLFGFRDMAFFMIFYYFFFKKLDKKTNRISIFQPYSWVLSGYIPELQI